MPPRVSVVIPVFNRPAAVRRAIRSVLTQTFHDFEILVVDDASTDDTAETIVAFHDPRIKLIRHDQRRGGSAARNTGISASSAPFIAFLDSDDEWMPGKLERQLDLFERCGDRLGLTYTGTERVYADGSADVYIPIRQENMFRSLLTTNVIGETSVGMVRRSVLLATGNFDESLPASQEMDLWLRISERFDVDFIAEALVRVAKGDSGRITTNIAATTGGREIFRRKHGSKMKEADVLHLYLRKSGWWYFRAARDLRNARRCYVEALWAKPQSLMTFLVLTLTFVPMSFVDQMAKAKHWATVHLSRIGRRRPARLSAGGIFPRDTPESSRPV
jgi:glycosyltransferase involved in cell wall biosynthesis